MRHRPLPSHLRVTVAHLDERRRRRNTDDNRCTCDPDPPELHPGSRDRARSTTLALAEACPTCGLLTEPLSTFPGEPGHRYATYECRDAHRWLTLWRNAEFYGFASDGFDPPQRIKQRGL